MSNSNTSNSKRKYDLVVFGASGFTGQYVVEELARTVEREQSPGGSGGGGIRWAIAGRDMKKLQDVLDAVTKQIGKSVVDIPIIIADVSSESSLGEMCRQTSVLINCVGPYRFYGTAVVQASIENGTHHIDICGEPAWLEQTQIVFDGKAKETGVYVLEACGFDSIPSDLGLEYTKQQFAGTLNSVEAYVKFNLGSEKGANINYGTYLSAIHGVANSSELKGIRGAATAMPHSKHRLAKRPTVFHSEDVHSWCLPFLGADKSIVYRSTVYEYEHRQQNPIQFQIYLRCASFWRMMLMIISAVFFGIFAKFSCGRKILEKYPECMTCGLVSKTGPSRRQIEASSFDITFVALGYESSPTENSGPPTKKIMTQVSGPEMGYVTTPICVVQAAYVLLKEPDKLPKGGGVFTPRVAFSQTSLISRLQDHNMKFTVLEK